MKTSTARNHLERLSARQAEIVFLARLSGSTHAEILSRMKERVWEDPARNRLPVWAEILLSERFNTAMARLYLPDLHARELEDMLRDAREGKDVKPARYLRWALRVDGREVTSHEISALRAAGDESVWERVEGAHVWNHTGQPFDAWKRTGMAREGRHEQA